MRIASRKISADLARTSKIASEYRIYPGDKLWAIHVDDSDMGHAIVFRLKKKAINYLGKIGYRGNWASAYFGLNFAVRLPEPLSRQRASELTDTIKSLIDEYRACPLEFDESREYKAGAHDPELGWYIEPFPEFS